MRGRPAPPLLRRLLPPLAFLSLLLPLLWLLSARRALRVPVWGVAVEPGWVVVRGRLPVAVVTLAVPDARHAPFVNVSLAEKAAYAAARGYWLVVCTRSLDPARAPVWSKLRLLHAVLHQVAPTALWVDVDAVLLARHEGVEALLEASPGADLHAQHDFHRYSVYFNAGVMLLRRSGWTDRLLAEAYDSHRVILLRRWVYSMAEQDALNFAAARSMRRPRGTAAGAEGWKVRVHAYPRLWCFAHEATEADGRVALGVLAVHFPNCRDGRCAEAFRATAALALAQPTDRPPHDGRGPHRVFPADMERLQLWPFSRAA